LSGKAIGLYEVSRTLIDWLSNNDTLHTIEQSAFDFWREALSVVHVVRLAEMGKTNRLSAMSALRQFNEETGHNLSYEDARDLTYSRLFSPEGEWVVFTDNPIEVLLGREDDITDALITAPDSVQWAIIWLVAEHQILVIQSPWGNTREPINEYASEGLRPGTVPTSVLPPDIEAALRYDIDGERDSEDSSSDYGVHETAICEMEEFMENHYGQ